MVTVEASWERQNLGVKQVGIQGLESRGLRINVRALSFKVWGSPLVEHAPILRCFRKPTRKL